MKLKNELKQSKNELELVKMEIQAFRCLNMNQIVFDDLFVVNKISAVSSTKHDSHIGILFCCSSIDALEIDVSKI